MEAGFSCRFHDSRAEYPSLAGAKPRETDLTLLIQVPNAIYECQAIPLSAYRKIRTENEYTHSLQ